MDNQSVIISGIENVAEMQQPEHKSTECKNRSACARNAKEKT